ncbi:MAG TPA: hypothetical protein VNO26_02080 [Candidatus Limnocylindria bacterium]|nr:hypothetical protein [Candidatus Limnocylindria bacterium]
MPDEDEKDRLGDTLHKKERAEEERYFAEQDRLRLARLRERAAAAERGESCPRCGRPIAAPGSPPPPGACDCPAG